MGTPFDFDDVNWVIRFDESSKWAVDHEVGDYSQVMVDRLSEHLEKEYNACVQSCPWKHNSVSRFTSSTN